jgi:DNA-binding NarL/FixJ family response regulator
VGAATDWGPRAHVNAQYLVGNRSPANVLLRAFFFASLEILMAKAVAKSSLKVCLLSPHPMVLDEFRRLLKSSGFNIVSKQLESMFAPDLRNLKVPRAAVYVVDAHAARQATGALLGNILDHFPAARLLVVREKLKEAESHVLLRQGVKGILNYEEAREQLPRALPLVADGGFWVPREVLSRFVDSILSTAQGRRLCGDSPADLSRREQEVLNGLLENLANKEVADRLRISERTVKFHVSSLLAKFGVQRRADLLLLCLQRHEARTFVGLRANTVPGVFGVTNNSQVAGPGK